jgi:hypothetical protein
VHKIEDSTSDNPKPFLQNTQVHIFGVDGSHEHSGFVNLKISSSIQLWTHPVNTT